MIDLNFGLWWSGCKLSYLRYLTFKSLRHFHPDSKIELFIGDEFRKDGHSWNCEKQDFESEDIGKDYLDEVSKLDVEVCHVDMFSEYHPNYQSDFFRWWYLKNNGGFYLDTDQIILKSFEGLPLDNDLIFSAYKAKSCGVYTPVGVLGASKKSEIVNLIDNVLVDFINTNNYNSAGPFMFRKILFSKEFNDRLFNAPPHYFYPAPESYLVNYIYEGKLKIPEESLAIHWFGGHELSQKFNESYTEEFAKNSNDSISVFLRNSKII